MPSLANAAALGKTSDQLFGPLSVLVVDDMPAIRRMLRQMLQHLGVNGDILEAGDGQEAWEILQERPFDLIVCDINMPRLSGLDLLRRLRATQQYQTTPFLMISGEVSEDIVAASAESEVDGYLIKPFKIDSLEARLRSILLHRYQPSRGEILFREANELLVGGRPAEALSVLDQLAHPPFRKQAKVLNLMGECYRTLGSPDEAAACFKQALDLNPKYLRAYQNLAAVMESQGDLAAARGYLEAARKLSPLNPERLYKLGQLCLQQGAPEDARHYLEECWRIGQYVPPARRSEMAETFLAAGLHQVAEELFRRAIDAAPHDVHLYNRLGVALRRQQKHQQALEYYQQALNLDSNNEKVHFNMGVLFFDLGEKDKALEALGIALQINPAFTEAQDFLQRHFPAAALPGSPS
uniref:Response regulator n=1 Tax=Desulfobacca acetoxidans TaxID=60893 RepID=A0A7C3UWM2_9BACT